MFPELPTEELLALAEDIKIDRSTAMIARNRLAEAGK
jgi:predicted transcriptional regulator